MTKSLNNDMVSLLSSSVRTDRLLKSSGVGSGSGDKSLFAESQSAQYTGYQQAWRMLGFYVDCDSTNGCTRYLLWAAYVDMDYEGGGIGSYSFYEPTSKSYNSSVTCNKSYSSRCAKMDCHDVDNTHWQLMGIFKQEYFSSQWFEQLFKHEGSCVWDNSYTTEFMQTYYNAWPEGCIATNYKSINGQKLYMSLKPSYGGYMALSLYTDAICKTEYDQGDASVKLKLAASDKGYLYGATLESWNKNMNAFKYCQPCISYNMNSDGDYYASNQNAYYGNYGCKDANGDVSVNQCMKYRYKTDMEAATIKDLELAEQQGGILQVNVGGRKYGAPLSSISSAGIYQNLPHYRSASSGRQHTAQDAFPFMIFSISILVGGIIALVGMIQWKRQRQTARSRQLALKEPLMNGID